VTISEPTAVPLARTLVLLSELRKSETASPSGTPCLRNPTNLDQSSHSTGGSFEIWNQESRTAGSQAASAPFDRPSDKRTLIRVLQPFCRMGVVKTPSSALSDPNPAESMLVARTKIGYTRPYTGRAPLVKIYVPDVPRPIPDGWLGPAPSPACGASINANRALPRTPPDSASASLIAVLDVPRFKKPNRKQHGDVSSHFALKRSLQLNQPMCSAAIDERREHLPTLGSSHDLSH